MPALDTAFALAGLSTKMLRRPHRGRPPKNEMTMRASLFPGVPPQSSATTFQERFLEDLVHGTRNVDAGANADEVAARLIASYPRQQPIIEHSLRARMTGVGRMSVFGAPAREMEVTSRKEVARALRAAKRA